VDAALWYGCTRMQKYEVKKFFRSKAKKGVKDEKKKRTQ
jgi:hypothetical protein